jgi:hypothetical protein
MGDGDLFLLGRHPKTEPSWPEPLPLLKGGRLEMKKGFAASGVILLRAHPHILAAGFREANPSEVRLFFPIL